MSKTTDDLRTILQNMMSHGIFDAETISANMRTLGWAFNYDPNQHTETGGVYLVRTPDGKQGYIDWYTIEHIQELTAGSGFLMEGIHEGRFLLAWVFADQIGRIVFGHGFDEHGEPPGEVYKNVMAELGMQVEKEKTLAEVVDSGELSTIEGSVDEDS